VLRFAFSPTHTLDLSSLRVALLNYLVCQQRHEKCIIRIDNANKEAHDEKIQKEALELLSLFSLEFEHIVYQSENLKYYQKMAMQLLMQKKAFSCFCSDNKLQELQQEAKKANKPYSYDGFCSTLSDETVLNVNAPFTIRIQKPDTSIDFTDELQGKLSFKPYEVDAFVILNHDKTPTYNYACAIDDMLYNVSTIIRDKKHLCNTARQIHIQQSLNYTKTIEYIHVEDIVNAKNSKLLGKKEKYNSIQWLINEGFLPSAIANYLIAISTTCPNEIFTLEEAVSWFDIQTLHQSPALFDIDALCKINQQHLLNLCDLHLSKLLGFADEDIGKLAKLYLENSSTIKELQKKVDLLFSKKRAPKGFESEFKLIQNCLQQAPFFENFDDFKSHIKMQTNLSEEQLLKPLYALLLGEQNSMSLEKVYSHIKNYLGEIIK
jgi:glutamyl-tRNA synthetase